MIGKASGASGSGTALRRDYAGLYRRPRKMGKTEIGMAKRKLKMGMRRMASQTSRLTPPLLWRGRLNEVVPTKDPSRRQNTIFHTDRWATIAMIEDARAHSGTRMDQWQQEGETLHVRGANGSTDAREHAIMQPHREERGETGGGDACG